MAEQRSPGTRLAVDAALYTVARLVLVVALTAVIFYGGRAVGLDTMPLAVAGLFALAIGMPLGMAIFAPLRRRVTASIEVVDGRRRAERDDLRARLRGEKPSAPESVPDADRDS